MKKFLYFILLCLISCNDAFAQSLGKMRLGCSRIDVVMNLPKGFNICKTNTNNQLTYATSEGDEYVSFYLTNGIVYKILMHKSIERGFDSSSVKSKLEDTIISLCDSWGKPSYVGENIYWNFPSSKATFSYTISSTQMEMDPLRFSGSSVIKTFYKCYADIKLEKRTSMFE